MNKDGGPAFPTTAEHMVDMEGRRYTVADPGMSLRDYAEIHFTAALLSNPEIDVTRPDLVRVAAVGYADAMLEEREK